LNSEVHKSGEWQLHHWEQNNSKKSENSKHRELPCIIIKIEKTANVASESFAAQVM
jgi:hypothetical protein